MMKAVMSRLTQGAQRTPAWPRPWRSRLAGLAFLVAFAAALPAGAEPGNCDSRSVSVHCGATPSAAFDADGRLWVAFVHDQQVFVGHSDDLGRNWSEPVAVNPIPEDAEHNGENRPKILIDQDQGQGSTNHPAIYVSWTRKTSPRFTGEIRFSRSTDGGKTFSAPRTVNDDGLLAGHRFDSLFQTESGLLYLTWIDKRDLKANTDAGEPYKGAAIYYAVSKDRGKTFSPNHRVANHSCECCRIAVAPRGPDNIAIFWRHIFGANTRDHAVAELTPGGAIALLARASHDEWRIDACPHHGPTMAQSAFSDDDYHLGWFSNGEAHQGIYYGRFSFADARTHDVIRIEGMAGAGHPFLETYDGTVYLLWKGFDGNKSSLRLMRSHDDGASWSAPETLVATSQASDHPLIVKSGQGLHLSWHTDEFGYIFAPLAPRAGFGATQPDGDHARVGVDTGGG